MNFSTLNTVAMIEVKNASRMIEYLEAEETTYKTRIMSDGKQEATDTITK
ncbi:MAG: hypothetical protein ACXW5U_06970 [Thermoanaerobaculia bacterium]